mmetsp:Transcript_102331/g.176740  ORF Transcript_102331/g.176740 Transcript_102331/m.176740 type:complete len:133 (-) Transcript_102331:241-639(-)
MHGWWLLVLLAWLTAAKKKPEVLYADVPFLECNVCKEAVSNVHQIATSVRRSQGKVREDDMFELTETLCDPKGKAGKWLTMYDVQLEAGGLKMVNKNKQGQCLFFFGARALSHAWMVVAGVAGMADSCKEET